ncbi:uncharacterized protein EV154DRAFT_529296 [Mucor mucedo]|uniref:uncharacterized protein n=1 Tax=Mucor mucedo TaxID=29922 RepID=UPI00221E7CDE|nr:uncharacterized protein EV154DRAFT_529296 [Mucor mucedo]KAI7872225.1 hypothetical protein EV154DRAFT_529296 [Mucor mucedo]
MLLVANLDSVTYTRIRAEADRRKAEDMDLWLECRQDDPMITLEEVKALIGRYHNQDVTLPERPRGISKYNVYCQQEKEKLLGGESGSTYLTPKILSEGYQKLSDAEHAELEATVMTMEKRNEMENLINTGLSRREVWETLMSFLKALNRFHGTEFIGIFGKKKTWNHVCCGVNVSEMDLGRWKKEVRLYVNPKSRGNDIHI